MLIYIHESGDLGKRGSSHFVMTAVVTEQPWERPIGHAIRRTLRVKVERRHILVNSNEQKVLVGTSDLGTRLYFWKHVETTLSILHLQRRCP